MRVFASAKHDVDFDLVTTSQKFSGLIDFDFNVVIRSLIYDDLAKKLSYQVGGAITYDSDPEAEYEETLIKARAIRELFDNNY